MKIFLFILSLCTVAQIAQALPGADYRHSSLTGDSGVSLKMFRGTVLCNASGSLWVWYSGSGDVCTPNGYGIYKGNNSANTQACCKEEYDPGPCPLCRTEEDWQKHLAQKEQQSDEEAQLRVLFQALADDPEYREDFYGYVGTTNRSPNTGRTTSAKARLDACLGYGDTDATTSGTNCRTVCDNSTKNDYCTQTGTNNGVSGVTAAVCKDRCDCVWGDATCNYL